MKNNNNAVLQAKSKVGVAAYIEDTKLEMKRVNWPSKHVVLNASIAVMIIVVFMTMYIFGIDFILSKASAYLGVMG